MRGKEAAPPKPEAGKALAQAYSMLPLDALFLAPYEQTWLKEQTSTPPAVAKTVSEQEPTRFSWTIDGHKVVVLVFPLTEEKTQPTDDMIERTLKATKELADQADLLVGLSPWGYEAEENFLKQHPDAVDLLLGGGAGKAVAGLQYTDRTFWARGYHEGKAFIKVDLNFWPKKRDEIKVPKPPFLSEVLAVRETVTPDPDIEQLISKLD